MIGGCQAPHAEDSGFEDLSVENPSVWSYEAGDTAELGVDLDLVTAAVQEWIDLSFTYNAAGLIAAYDDTMEARGLHSQTGLACPEFESTEIGTSVYEHWAGVCTTAENAAFAGQAWAFKVEDNALDGSEVTYSKMPDSLMNYSDNSLAALYTGRGWTGMSYIRDVEGERFWGAGDLVALEGERNDGWLTQISSAVGSFHWQPQGGVEAWYTDLVTVDWSVRVDRESDGGGLAMMVNGGISSLPETGATVVATFPFDTCRACCDLEGGGVLEVRDATGLWVSVEFQGGTQGSGSCLAGCSDLEQKASDCDGCGRVYIEHKNPDQEKTYGEICLDHSAWFGFEGAPW